jgi:nitrite reductase/ring-hydroxylating ferredoxin subunit
MSSHQSKTKVASIQQFDENPVTRAEVAGKKYLLYHDGEQVHAYRNVCPHQYGPVTEGLVHTNDEGGHKITCPWHGWEYDLSSGENPMESIKRHLPRVEVTIEDGDVYI